MSNKNPATAASQMILNLTQQASSKMDIDRTIGTIASLSLTLGLYRFVSAMVKGKLNETRAWTFVRVLIGAALTKRLQEFSSLKGTRNGHDKNGRGFIGTSDQSCDYTVLDGSCHCNSVCFTLRAPSTVKAVVNKGKLHFPHHTTAASNFKLSSGAQYLSVYYVSIPKDNQEVVAGHTFCSRCGVHILRAPDPNSEYIEINTDCIDNHEGIIRIETQYLGDDDWSVAESKCHDKQTSVTPKYTTSEEEDQSMAWPNVLASMEETSSTTGVAMNQTHVVPNSVPMSFTHQSMKQFHNVNRANIPASDRGKTSTPTTSISTHIYGDSFSRSGNSFAEDDYFQDENDQAESVTPSLNSAFTSPLSVGMQSAYTWSHSANRVQPFQLSPLPLDDLSLKDFKSPIPPPSARMKDQLQHYLKKHISPSGQKRGRNEQKMVDGNDPMRNIPKLPVFSPSEANEKTYF